MQETKNQIPLDRIVQRIANKNSQLTVELTMAQEVIELLEGKLKMLEGQIKMLENRLRFCDKPAQPES